MRTTDLTLVIARRRLPLAALLLTLVTVPFALPQDVEPIPDEDCLLCHSDPDLTKTDENGDEISIFVDEAVLSASAHATNTCFSCHNDITFDHPDDEVVPKRVLCATCHEEQSVSYGASVHGQAALAGDVAAAGCGDCHGAHDVLPPTSADSPMHWSHLADTCGECHPGATEDVAASVHGTALRQGIREAPTCTDCHAEHRIEDLRAASPVKLAELVCAKCHAAERINTKFKMPSRQIETFFESYHGLAARMGDTHAANCASCHGYHRILPSSDPTSSIHPDHLVETCGSCHAGATENFALGKVHVDADLDGGVGPEVNRWVRRFYVGLIIVVIGLMLAHNFLDWVRHAIQVYRSRERVVMRMPRAERYQHAILVVSFVVLALSGFALKFPDSWLALLFGADEVFRRWLHRISGVVLLALGVYHLIFVAVTERGRRLVADMWPSRSDLPDVRANLRYFVGRSRSPARFSKFGYVEKLEYWAVVWGVVIMGVTGLLIWLKIPVTQMLPRWAIDVATTVHYYEAILACLAILVWHMYHVIGSPDSYPMNWAWWDGKVSQERHREGPDSAPSAEAPLPRVQPEDGDSNQTS